eukprot:1869250-Prymnesium_polylepis.2
MRGSFHGPTLCALSHPGPLPVLTPRIHTCSCEQKVRSISLRKRVGLSLGLASWMLLVLAAMPSAHTRAMDFLSRVHAVDCAASAAAGARRFIVGDETLGRVLPQAAAVLARFPETFDVDEQTITLRDDPAWLECNPETCDVELVEARSAAVGAVLHELRGDGSVPMLSGWRDEAFAVRPSFYAPPRLVVERAAGPLFGLPSYGCFTNGFVAADGGRRPTHVWLGKRSESKPTWPGLLDCIAAGGIAAGDAPYKAVVKECAEEAGIPSELAAGLVSVGGVSYPGFNEDRWGIKSDVLFNVGWRGFRTGAPSTVGLSQRLST